MRARSACAFALLAALVLPTGPARASALIELLGCSSGWNIPSLEQAVRREAGHALVADGVQLRARFDCEVPTRVWVSVHEPKGASREAQVDLAAVPDAVRPRVLALVWAELLAAPPLEPTLVSPSNPVEAQASASTVAPIEDVPAQSTATQGVQSTQPTIEPTTGAQAKVDSKIVRERVAQRRALFTKTDAATHAFEVYAAAAVRRFFAAGGALFGAELSFRLGPLALMGVYAQSRALDVGIGAVEGRVVAGGLELVLACLAGQALQSCAVLGGELGVGQLAGQAQTSATTASGLNALYSAGSFGFATRVSGDWMALEIMSRVGFARGPTARADGRDALAFQGGFFALSFGATVQP